jgi:hypothetical protein
MIRRGKERPSGLAAGRRSHSPLVGAGQALFVKNNWSSIVAVSAIERTMNEFGF